MLVQKHFMDLNQAEIVWNVYKTDTRQSGFVLNVVCVVFVCRRRTRERWRPHHHLPRVLRLQWSARGRLPQRRYLPDQHPQVHTHTHTLTAPSHSHVSRHPSDNRRPHAAQDAMTWLRVFRSSKPLIIEKIWFWLAKMLRCTEQPPSDVSSLLPVSSLDAASIGFVIIIDRRKDKWSSVKASLSRIAVSSHINVTWIPRTHTLRCLYLKQHHVNKPPNTSVIKHKTPDRPTPLVFCIRSTISSLTVTTVITSLVPAAQGRPRPRPRPHYNVQKMLWCVDASSLTYIVFCALVSVLNSLPSSVLYKSSVL